MLELTDGDEERLKRKGLTPVVQGRNHAHGVA